MFLNVAWKLTRSQTFNGFISATVWLSVVGTALGVATLISITSVMNGFDHDIREKIFSITDHIKIYSSKTGKEDYKKVVKKLGTIPDVDNASVFVSTPAVAMKDRVSFPVSIVGLFKNQNNFPTKEIAKWYRKTSPGKFLATVTTAMEKNYNVHAGDKVVTFLPSQSAPMMGMNVRSKRLPVQKVVSSIRIDDNLI